MSAMEMRVDAMLCDFAQVSGGKLYVTGAAINLLGTPTYEAPHPANVWVGLTVLIPWTATNQMHKLRIWVQDSDQNRVMIFQSPPGMVVADEDRGAFVAQFNAGRAPTMQPGEASLMPLAVPLAAALPHLGLFSAIVEIDGTEMTRVPFRLLAPQLQAPGQMMGGSPTDMPRF